MAFLNKGLEIVVRDERPDRAGGHRRGGRRPDHRRRVDGGADGIHGDDTGGIERRFKYDDGLVDYVKHLNRTKDPVAPQHHRVRGDQRRRRA